MTDAPSDRALARNIRNLAWGNWAAGTERAMLLGLQGEVRDVCYPHDDNGSLLAKRREMLNRGELRAVVYLSALRAEEILQVSLVELYHESGDRSTHMLITRPEDRANWFSVSADSADHWIQNHWQTGEEA